MQTGPKNERIHYTRTCLSNFSLKSIQISRVCRILFSSNFGYRLGMLWQNSDQPTKTATAAIQAEHQKKHKKITGFYGLITGFVRFNYGFSKTRFLLNFRKYGFSTG